MRLLYLVANIYLTGPLVAWWLGAAIALARDPSPYTALAAVLVLLPAHLTFSRLRRAVLRRLAAQIPGDQRGLALLKKGSCHA
jgi:hypothetical protein